MKVFIRIKPPSKWKVNHLERGLKKRNFVAEYSKKEKLDNSAEILITNYLTEKELNSLRNLKYLIIPTSGTENIPIEKLNKKGIKLYRNKRIIAEGVSNYALDKLKTLIPSKADKFLKNKSVTLLGFGNIGKLIHNKLKKYGCKFYIVKKNKTSGNSTINLQEIDKILPQTDILINTLPLNSDTKGALFDKTDLIKRGAIIVNLSRKGILNEKAILKKVHERYFFGAILDVYSEDISPSKIKSKHVIITPHIAGIYGDALNNMIKFIDETIIKIQEDTK